MIRKLLALATAAVTLAAATAGFASAATATAVSSNWAGYAISGTTFSSVSGSWTQPAADCSSSTGGSTAAAFWVGLGGDSQASTALEQTGTEAECAADGTASYTAWYELVPAAAVTVPLKVTPGDRISASVRVAGTRVTMRLRNVTTGKVYAKVLHLAGADTSSAEWVAEAPSAVTPLGSHILSLTDFGAIRFTSATATSTSGHTGSVSDPAWTATRIHLASQTGGGPGRPYGPFAPAGGGTEAVTGALSSTGAAFSVTWRRTTDTPTSSGL